MSDGASYITARQAINQGLCMTPIAMGFDKGQNAVGDKNGMPFDCHKESLADGSISHASHSRSVKFPAAYGDLGRMWGDELQVCRQFSGT